MPITQLDSLPIWSAICGNAPAFGVVRPCHHRLRAPLFEQWMAHLCGLCLALCDLHGQNSRFANHDEVRGSDYAAAAFEQQHIAPAVVVSADPLAHSDDPEPGGPVQRGAGRVLREDARLDRPDTGGLGRFDQRC
jgi:hypothetical protein